MKCTLAQIQKSEMSCNGITSNCPVGACNGTMCMHGAPHHICNNVHYIYICKERKLVAGNSSACRTLVFHLNEIFNLSKVRFADLTIVCVVQYVVVVLHCLEWISWIYKALNLKINKFKQDTIIVQNIRKIITIKFLSSF